MTTRGLRRASAFHSLFEFGTAAWPRGRGNGHQHRLGILGADDISVTGIDNIEMSRDGVGCGNADLSRSQSVSHLRRLALKLVLSSR